MIVNLSGGAGMNAETEEKIDAIYEKVVESGNLSIVPSTIYGSGGQTLEITTGKYICIAFAHGYDVDSNYQEVYWTFNVSIEGTYETVFPLTDYQLVKAGAVSTTKYMIIKKEESETIKITATPTRTNIHIIAFAIS